MRFTPRFTIRSVIAVTVLLSLAALIPELQAQFRLVGSRPTVLSPRPVAPLQGGNSWQGSNKPDRDRPTLNMTLVDPGPIGAETTTNVYFAQVAIGGGYSTLFTLLNTGSTSVVGTLFLNGQDGNPLTVNANNPQIDPREFSSDDLVNAAGSNFPVVIPSGGSKILTVTPLNPGDSLKAGWARIQSAGGSLGGVGTFQQTEGGVLKTIAGVLATSAVPFATIPVDDDNTQDRFTGYALANPNNENINVKLVTLDENGSILETVTPSVLNPLGPQKQVARFFFQDLPPSRAKFKGSVVLVAQGAKTFAVVALVQNKGLLTAIPVIPEKAPVVPN